jgi:AraC-like DNA-binding protein
MPVSQPADKVFLEKLTKIVEENLSNDQFGVSELADKIGMSRSNLLRKVKKLTDLSVSLFIRQIRLESAMELLEEGGYTVSEITYRVGFSSTSYFVKCFHDHYGYPPGEADKHKNSTQKKYELKEKHTHQLAAIMFTDIQGYTALMQQDEQKGVAFRKRHREIFKPVT